VNQPKTGQYHKKREIKEGGDIPYRSEKGKGRNEIDVPTQGQKTTDRKGSLIIIFKGFHRRRDVRQHRPREGKESVSSNKKPRPHISADIWRMSARQRGKKGKSGETLTPDQIGLRRQKLKKQVRAGSLEYRSADEKKTFRKGRGQLDSKKCVLAKEEEYIRQSQTS